MTTKIETILDRLIGVIEAVPGGVMFNDGGSADGFRHVPQLMPGDARGLGALSDRKFTLVSESAVPSSAVTTGYEFRRTYLIRILYAGGVNAALAVKRADSDALLIRQVLRNPQVWPGGAPSGLRAVHWIEQGAPETQADGALAVSHRIRLDYAEI